MERLLIDTGGRPFKNEDALEYLQAFTIFEQWFNDLALGDCIVYGCDISGGVGNYTVTAGVLYVSGKLRLFDGVAGVAFPLVLEEESIEINLREYEEGVNKYTAEQLKMVPDVGGAFNFDLTTPRTREQLLGPAGTKTKILNIGDWDMNATLFVLIAHGLAFAKIIKIKVTIFVDDDSPAYPFASNIEVHDSIAVPGTIVLAGAVVWDGVNVQISRLAGAVYQSIQYDKLAYNRGLIEITYLP